MNPNRETCLTVIREKCIAANPEIVELKFGCVILTKKYSWEGTQEIVTAVYPDDIDEVELAFREKHIKQEDVKEIIGRPPRLADVLLAMGETDWYVGQHGRFFKWSRNLGEMVGQPVSWNLRADDLEQQSEETINFLYKLLSD